MWTFFGTRLRIVVAAVGGALAFLPLAGGHVLLAAHTSEQARAKVDDLAQQIVERADAIVDDGLDTLTDLAVSGAANCAPSGLDAMRRAVYAHYSIKEIGITDRAGHIVCNHIGDRVEAVPISASFPSRNGNIQLQVVQLGDTARHGLMMTWPFGPDGGLSAVIPAEVVATDLLPSDLRKTSLGLMTLGDGTLLGTVPVQSRTPNLARFDRSTIVARTRSALFPYELALYVPYSNFAGDTSNLRTYVNLGGGVLGFAIIGFVLYALRRPQGEINEIRDALDRSEFIPYYQPVVDLRNGKLLGCEVLMRWRKADGTIVPPGAFIPLAEATGLALPMTHAIMVKVRDELNDAYGKRRQLKVGINLFDDHFDNLRIVKEIQQIFGASKIAYSQLSFEVTERQPLTDIVRARVVIRKIQALGAMVALDDAGTGHGGLAYLQQLGMDILKIDKLFIDTIGTDQISAPILDSLVRLGQDLGMQVIAEGVETIEQVEYLRLRSVVAAQGYLFAPPLPGPAFLDLIEAMDPESVAADATPASGDVPLALSA